MPPPRSKAKPGSTWTTMLDGRLWPVMVFPVTCLTEKFMSTKTSPTAFPVFFMGRYSLTWREFMDLNKFNPLRDYKMFTVRRPQDDQDPKAIEQHVRAFHEAKQGHDLKYFQDIMTAKEESHKSKSSLAAAKEESYKSNSSLTAAKEGSFKAKGNLTAAKEESYKSNSSLTADKEGSYKDKRNLSTAKEELHKTTSSLSTAKINKKPAAVQKRLADPEVIEISDDEAEDDDEHSPLSTKMRPVAHGSHPVVKSLKSHDKAQSTEKTRLRDNVFGNVTDVYKNDKKSVPNNHSTTGQAIKDSNKRKAPTPLECEQGLLTPPPTLKKPRLSAPITHVNPGEDENLNFFSGPPSPTHNPSKLGQQSSRQTMMRKGSASKTAATPEPIKADEIEGRKVAEVTIIIGSGDDETKYVFKKSLVTRFPYFQAHMSPCAAPSESGAESARAAANDDNHDAVVQSPELAKLDKGAFDPVAEFIRTDDYTPVLVGGDGSSSSGSRPHLRNVQSLCQHDAAVRASGLLWHTAAVLELADLRRLICRKMQAISPLQDASLLLLTRMVFFLPVPASASAASAAGEGEGEGAEVDGAMREWLKNEVADRYYQLLMNESMLLSRVLRGSFDLARFVHGKLAADSGAGLRYLENEE
ncbi:hypothetical protein MBLNU459_g1106t1 [Dothideomycetes sp. NU459]